MKILIVTARFPQALGKGDSLTVYHLIRFLAPRHDIYLACFYSSDRQLDGLEPACEDYGQAVVYRGGIPGSEHLFALDAHHLIERGRMFPVCGNTYRMLSETRFRDYFDFYGSSGQENSDTHAEWDHVPVAPCLPPLV